MKRVPGRVPALMSLGAIASSGLAACATGPRTEFELLNGCEVEVTVGLRTDDSNPSDPTGMTYMFPDTSRSYTVARDESLRAVAVVVVPQVGGLTQPVNTRRVDVPGALQGAGTSGDPYVIEIDGDLCDT